MEKSCKEGFSTKYLNSNYITLIPKCDNPWKFVDFQFISLCNLEYKVNNNIISNRPKPLLTNVISQRLVWIPKKLVDFRSYWDDTGGIAFFQDMKLGIPSAQDGSCEVL